VLASRLGIAPAPGLSDYLAGHAEPAEILRTVKLTDPPVLNGAGPGGQTSATIGHSVVCIPAGTPTPHAAELLGSDRLKAFLDQVTEIYDAVILDSSPLLPVADARELLPHVDGLIVCARELQTTREQARATRETLDHLPERPTVLVITGVRPSGDDYAGYTYSYTHSSAS
jgi:Mrp family chromosome partitioning ATPase